MCALEIKLNQDIISDDIENILIPLYSGAWGWFDNPSYEIMNSRIDNPRFTAIAYDDMHPKEEKFIGNLESNLLLNDYKNRKMPVVMLQGIPLKTGGNYSKIPSSFFDIFDQTSLDSDTILLYSLVALPSRRGKLGNGAIEKTLNFAKSYFSKDKNIEHIWTFTPDYAPIWKTHENRGARNTDEIKYQSRVPVDFRPSEKSFSHPLVNTRIMSYKG